MATPRKPPPTTVLGKRTEWPDSPDEAVLERVPNPHPDTHYPARFTAPEFTSLCPVTGQPDFAHLVIDYAPERLADRVQVAEALPGLVPQPRRLPRGLHRRDRQADRRSCSSRTGCASAATGTRAAACRSTSSGRPARARGPVAARSGRRALSRAWLTGTSRCRECTSPPVAIVLRLFSVLRHCTRQFGGEIERMSKRGISRWLLAPPSA